MMKGTTTASTTTTLAVRLLACALTLTLAGCFEADSKKDDAATGGGKTPTTTTGGGTTTPTTGTTNSAPTISGAPPTVAKTTLTYTFRPTATDANGDKLTFTIAGKPDWATFDTNTGTLTGTPADGITGTYSNIQIKVSDGKAEAALPTFSITVSPPVIGSATLSWAPPATNEDGSALTDLSGYVIRYGKTAGVLDQKIQLNSAGITTVVVENLVEGTWYFTMSSVNASGVESRPTGYVSKTIG